MNGNAVFFVIFAGRSINIEVIKNADMINTDPIISHTTGYARKPLDTNGMFGNEDAIMLAKAPIKIITYR
jgi:hypothetical protein